MAKKPYMGDEPPTWKPRGTIPAGERPPIGSWIQGDDGKPYKYTETTDGNRPILYDPKTGKLEGQNPLCFITTAVCKTLQKPDDCEELMKFRFFRDTFMQETPEMRAEVAEYYIVAPKICDAIDKYGEEANEKYLSIWEEYLKPAFETLDNGKLHDAHDLYKKMVFELKGKYLSESYGGI